jgi:predicted nucleotidyltransferase component of viral defense system
MNTIISSMLAPYDCESRQDYENALKEIIQELALLGLWRSKFFETAAFYGGTALRILYGLDRFSEDLDFSLLSPNPDFTLDYYNEAVEAELRGAGLDVTVLSKNKSQASDIRSAFIKAETLTQFMLINIPSSLHVGLHKAETLKIKMEIDINPPAGFSTEAKILLNPIPFSVLTYQKPDLFAGKIHALLCRPWVIRVKGRDWYDFVWYISRQIPVRLSHLEIRLKQSDFITSDITFIFDMLLNALKNKIQTTDFNQAKQDVLPFIRDPMAISLWSPDFFIDLLDKLLVV